MVGVRGSAEEANTITAALIMSTSFMLVISAFTSCDFSNTNKTALQIFVILETMAIYSSLGVLTVNLLINRQGQSPTELDRKSRQVVLVSLGFSIVGAFFRIRDISVCLPFLVWIIITKKA